MKTPRKKTSPNSSQTIIIDNFSAHLTRYVNGSLNSGLAKYSTTHSINCFGQPGNLQWMEQATQIDAAGSVITDLIVAGKARLENGITYVYAVGHLARVYKIQVNNPSGHNPQYDNPVLLATLSGGQTFKYGASVMFGGATERMYIGHDAGLTQLNFDGTTETSISGTWAASVPRQGVNFGSFIYYTNGTNIAEFSLATLTVTSSTKLSPGFPANLQARDIRLSSDGRYIVIVVSRDPLNDVTTINQDTNEISNNESYLFYWNGSDTATSSLTTFPAFATTAYVTFSNFEYIFGYDSSGAIISTPTKKILTNVFNEAPLPNAVGANGNLVSWMVPGFDSGFLKAKLYLYGSLDDEVSGGYYCQYKQAAIAPQTDVIQVPFQLLVTNFQFGPSTNGYTGGIVGIGRSYFSTFEYNGVTPQYRLYAFNNIPSGSGTAALGVYETQTQLFSKKVRGSEVRVYLEPLVANNSFQIDLIGSDGTVIPNTTQVFTAGTGPDAIGHDFVKYNPEMKPVYAIGLRISNLGTKNWICHKVEIDWVNAGE